MTDLTIGELLFLNRNRAGIDRRAFSLKYKTYSRKVRAWEDGKEEIPNEVLTFIDKDIVPTKEEIEVIDHWRETKLAPSNKFYMERVPHPTITVALTTPEKMFIDRRRKKLTQKEYGEIFEASQLKVARWERGEIKIPERITGILDKNIQPADNEILTIIRRRNGEKIADAAKKLGVDRKYLTDVERVGRGRARQLLMEYLNKN